MTYLVSILIPTLFERQEKCGRLLMDLYKQIKDNNLEDLVEVISMNDNRSVKLYEKRNTMQKLARGKYFLHHDDDDILVSDFCKTVVDFIQKMDEEVDVINIEQKAFVGTDIFVVKSDLNEGLDLRLAPRHQPPGPNIYKRYSWQWSLWNRKRFQHVMRSDIDTNAREDQNWLKRVSLEYPKTQAHIEGKILHEYHFEDPSESTCQ
jgi:hypothetical protein